MVYSEGLRWKHPGFEFGAKSNYLGWRSRNAGRQEVTDSRRDMNTITYKE